MAGLAIGTTAALVVAFTLLGLGLSVVVPMTFSAAGSAEGRDPASAVATVAKIGYTGWMFAPVSIGLIAQCSSLTTSFALVAGLLVLIALLADSLGDRRECRNAAS